MSEWQDYNDDVLDQQRYLMPGDVLDELDPDELDDADEMWPAQETILAEAFQFGIGESGWQSNQLADGF